jgi:hypothetical protein
MATPESPRDFVLLDVRTLSRLVEEPVQSVVIQAWGDCVMILATTALRISEVANLQVGDVGLLRGLLTVRRHTSPAAAAAWPPRRPRAGSVARCQSSSRCVTLERRTARFELATP